MLDNYFLQKLELLHKTSHLKIHVNISKSAAARALTSCKPVCFADVLVLKNLIVKVG